MPEPVSYPGGVQWAIKLNHQRRRLSSTTSQMHRLGGGTYLVSNSPYSEDIARELFDTEMRWYRQEFPDNPELWPELVSAQITWEATE